VLHLDTHLAAIIAEHGTATYSILAGIVFCETGLVLTPFLPGDSLLFAAGTFAALGSLSLPILLVTLTAAAIAGDAVNYLIGATLGPRAVARGLINPAFVAKTEAFYAAHGPRTVVLARFVPIVRTFAPFVAGVARMPWPTFTAFNCAGAALWVGSLTVAGAAFGTLPVVRDNFSAVVLGIVAVSLAPLAVEMWLERRKNTKGAGGGASA
jgi:membrane-associated protein